MNDDINQSFLIFCSLIQRDQKWWSARSGGGSNIHHTTPKSCVPHHCWSSLWAHGFLWFFEKYMLQAQYTYKLVSEAMLLIILTKSLAQAYRVMKVVKNKARRAGPGTSTAGDLYSLQSHFPVTHESLWKVQKSNLLPMQGTGAQACRRYCRTARTFWSARALTLRWPRY